LFLVAGFENLLARRADYVRSEGAAQTARHAASPEVMRTSQRRSVQKNLSTAARKAAKAGSAQLSDTLGGALRMRVIIVLAAVLALSSADIVTVGASATQLRSDLSITNTEIGLLVAVSSLVGALASVPFGVLADRIRRTLTLSAAIVLWGVAMIWSATASSYGELLLTRLFLGAVTAAAGPCIGSLVGDYFAGSERGRIYGFILSGELIGAGFGFTVTGDIAALSWRLAFFILAIPAFVLAWAVIRLPEPRRGGRGALAPEPGTAAARAAKRHATALKATSDEAHVTDAQLLVRERKIVPDPALVLHGDVSRLGLAAAMRHVLQVRTNVVLIASSALGYFFLAGVQIFGIEFVKGQYDLGQVAANGLLLIVGIGAIVGVLAGGALSDRLLRRRYLNSRITVSALATVGTVVFFVPAVFMRSAAAALPYLFLAILALSAQNPPLDAARLDIMPPRLWGRAESVRTLVRAVAVALAPLLFGAVSDYVFGGGRSGLQWTFVVMLVPLAVSAFLLFKGLRTYPGDVAAASASAQAGSPDSTT
jgi:MFS family permease